MKHPVRLVGFRFGRVTRMPRSLADLNGNTWLKKQKIQIIVWAKKNGHEIVKFVAGTTTSTKPAFAKTADFRRAIQIANNLGCDLVAADIQEMLGRTDPQQILECLDILDAAPVIIWDAALNATWNSLPKNRRQEVMLKAIAIRGSRSKPIKAGLRGRKASNDAPAVEHRRRGALINSKQADAAARRHADFVKAEIHKLAPGAVLSPSRLARALNDAGIPPARSSQWGHNSAKNLLRRFEELGLI